MIEFIDLYNIRNIIVPDKIVFLKNINLNMRFFILRLL